MALLSNTQLRLLQHSCGLSPEERQSAPTATDDGLRNAADLMTRGDFLAALRTVPALTALLDCRDAADQVHDPQSYFDLVGYRAAQAVAAAVLVSPAAAPGDGAAGLTPGPAPGAAAVQQLEAVLVAGVACLQLFVQYNLTGPSYGTPPPAPLDLFAPAPVARRFAAPPPRPSPSPAAATVSAAAVSAGPEVAAAPTAADGGPPAEAAAEGAEAEAAAAAGAGLLAEGGAEGPGGEASAAAAKPDGLSGLGLDSQSGGDCWAAQQLQLDGEDPVGRCPAPQWLLLARRLLLGPLMLQLQPGSSQGGRLGAAAAVAPLQGAPAGGEQDGAEAEPPAPPASSPLPALSRLLPPWPWWALRCVVSQQHTLDGRSHSLLSEASQLISLLVAPAYLAALEAARLRGPQATPSPASASAPAAACGPSGPSGLGGVLFLELALCQYAYGYVEAGRQYLVRAGQLLGLEPQLTGALGKRTVHQVDPKAQLVVVVASEHSRAAPPFQQYDTPVTSLGLDGGGTPANRELQGLVDESEVFPAPVLVGADGALLEARYSAPEQALLLAWATAVKKGTSADDLQEWQMAPWVEAVLSQPRAVFLTAAAARLHKIRHERSRGRTKERALLHMDQLAEAVAGAPPPGEEQGEAQQQQQQGPEGAAAAAESAEAAGPGPGPGAATEAAAAAAVEAATSGRRSVLSWAVWFPLQVCLRREAAEHYVSMGLVGAAIRVFESLELWDNVITCYRLIGKKALAEELIRRRLAVTPDDPRLWCALGDLHLDDKYYEEAWRRSGQRHTRSQRSLARSAMRRKDYPRAAGHWEAALALNPLHPEAWFALGFCYLKADRHREALRAFTRVTQQEPDNGEAWNNIAALWMHLGGYRPAFAALSEAVRHKRDSWQTWENYGRAALASGHYQQAVRGLQMCLQLSSGQRLFIDVVSGLLDVLEGRPPPRDAGTSLQAAAAAAAAGMRGVAGAEPEDQDESLKEDEMALGVPLLPLLADIPLRPPEGAGDDPVTDPRVGSDPSDAPAAATTPGTGDSASEHSGAAPPHHQHQEGSQGAGQAAGGSEALLSGREREVVMGGLGALLREAVNSPAASPALWGCLGRYWALRGEAESAKEARIKQVRGLAGGAFKSDPAKFAEYAEASEALCRCYLDCFRQGKPGHIKDLAAGRMHLRGLLRATAETFGEDPHFARLQALLDEVTQLEDEAIAASKAAKG